VFFSALLTVAVVCLAFFLLSFSIRRQTKSLLATTLAQRQRTIANLQAEGLEQLLRTSALMTDSPTLRAAMETYQSEARRSSDTRPDLLATIQTEVDRVAASLGRELFVVTDPLGGILAWSGAPEMQRRVGATFSAHPVIRHALDVDAPISDRNLAVMNLGGEYFRVGSVPILLQGFVIGSLTLGDRIDHRFVRRLRENFDCDFMVLADGRVVGSTLSAAVTDAHLAALRQAASSGTAGTRVAQLGGAEYVTVGLSLGADDGGRPVELYLLNSLSLALGDWNRSMVALVGAWGLFAVGLAGAAAWRMSRTLLRPLEQFVGFMRTIATSGEHARRFEGDAGCAEVETLNETYNQLMDSLLEHERRLWQRAREDLDRLERLKESEKLASLGRMLSGAAHEINNPLTGVFGNIELLLRDANLEPATRARLERIQQDSRRIVLLVRNLLKISHRDTGQKAPVDVQQVLRETADVRRHDFVGAGMRLDLELTDEPLRVLGSELELHQVFLNIINNAFDALQEGTADGHLIVRTERHGEHAGVTFADNGPGMKNPRRVFEHFYTTKGIGKGTGLGLSICHTIVQRHGGEITAENGEHGGAVFRLRLPLAAPEALAAAAEPAAAVPAAPEPRDTRLPAAVLIVDDEPTIVDLQKEILAGLGAAVVGVASGDEAIEVLRQRSFDIIVTDLKMPGSVSGQELFRWVESNLPQAARGFVFVSGDTAGEENRDFIERSGARFLAKPFTMHDYVRTLREVHETRTAMG
jgi:signal transduction histidine kinase/ActR/RegA family two-component response regulator